MGLVFGGFAVLARGPQRGRRLHSELESRAALPAEVLEPLLWLFSKIQLHCTKACISGRGVDPTECVILGNLLLRCLSSPGSRVRLLLFSLLLAANWPQTYASP